LRLLAVALLATLLTGTAAAASIVDRRTASGTPHARGALLRRRDFGSGWSAGPAPSAIPGLTCSAFSPSLAGVVERGAAASPTFQQSSSGPFVSQAAYVYDTPAEQALLWRRIVQPRLLDCVSGSLTHGSSQGVRFAVTSKHMLGLPKLPALAAGYRVAATASTSLQTIKVYLDMLVLGRGRIVTEISLSSLAQPVERGFELRLARTVSRRVPAH
jgi:hypothetical protein